MAAAGVLGDFTNVFAVFGAVAASYIALKVLLCVWKGLQAYVLSRSLGLAADVKKMGQWAGESPLTVTLSPVPEPV